MSKVQHTPDGGNVCIKGNKRITTGKCGCTRREKLIKDAWKMRFEYVCPIHMEGGSGG